MKMKDLVTITTTAITTAALTVVLFLVHSLEAGSDANPLAPTIAKPKLIANEVEMALTPSEGRSFKAGDQPAFELQAINTSDKPASVSIRLAMAASAPASLMSRVLNVPAVFWQQDRALTLGPKETRIFTFNTLTNLPANKIVSVALSEVDSLKQLTAGNDLVPGFRAGSFLPNATKQSIVALSISTLTPKVESYSSRKE